MSSLSARAVRAMLTLAMLVSLVVVPAAPAAAGTPSWGLTSSEAVVTRNGVNYRMLISATETGGVDKVTIQLYKRNDPDGVAAATQSHTFSFNITGNRFTHPSTTLTSAALNTASEMGVYGKLDLTFAQNAVLQKSCNGHNRARAGTLGGTLTFKPQSTTFDTIRVRPAKAVLTYTDGDCPTGGGGGGGGTTACPTPYKLLSATRTGAAPMSVVAMRTAGATSALLSITTGRPLANNEGTLSSSIAATVPASKVAIADDLRSATVSSSAGTWISGRGDMETPAPAATLSQSNCGSSKVAVTSYNTGALAGTLKGDFWLGPDRTLSHGSANGTLMRTEVLAQ